MKTHLAIAFLAALGAAANDEVLLTVKPTLCLTTPRQPSCDITFAIAWQAGKHGDYCLRNDLSSADLECWLASMSGTKEDERRVDASFTYWMAPPGLPDRLAEAAVKVLAVKSEDRRRNRRRRHAWSIL